MSHEPNQAESMLFRISNVFLTFHFFFCFLNSFASAMRLRMVKHFNHTIFYVFCKWIRCHMWHSARWLHLRFWLSALLLCATFLWWFLHAFLWSHHTSGSDTRYIVSTLFIRISRTVVNHAPIVQYVSHGRIMQICVCTLLHHIRGLPLLLGIWLRFL